MGDGLWGHEGATARRASTPEDGWQRGRASDLAEVGRGGNIMVASLLLSSAVFCKEPAAGIIWRGKSYFPPKVGNIQVEAGKKPSPKKWTIDVGTVVNYSQRFFYGEVNGYIVFLER